MKRIKVSGAIVPNDDKWIYDYLDFEATCPKDVEKALEEAKGDEVTVQINSGGGDIGAGNEIAYLIGQYPGKTTADIVGYCCSAATLPACAADKARMVPSALYMIHNVSTCASGDHQIFSHEAGVLKTASEAIAAVYAEKTGKSMDELAKLMDEETWLNAEQAKEHRFVDEIIKKNQNYSMLVNDSGLCRLLDKETIEKLRSQIKPIEDDKAFLLQKNTALSNLKILEMKGKML